MCEIGHAGGDEGRALCYFRFFVYREYREIRYLGNLDTGRYEKFSDRYPDLYELTRRGFARLWHQVRSETVLSLITKPFEEKVPLTLRDLEEAFRAGEWYPFHIARNNYGGPKHADIVLHTIRLGDAIAASRWTDEIPRELAVLKDIEHNRPGPARLDYKSLLDDLRSLGLAAPSECCLLDAD